MAEILYLIRHGRTDWNEKRGFMGQKVAVGLNALGKAQIRELGSEFLKPPAYLFYSPLQRTRESVELLKSYWSFASEPSESLLEVHFGQWTGMLESQVASTEAFQKYCEDPEANSPPGGESLREVQARALQAVRQARERSEERVGLVTHLDVIRVVLCHFLHLSLKHAFRFHIHTGSLTAICPGGSPAVLTVNWLPPQQFDY